MESTDLENGACSVHHGKLASAGPSENVSLRDVATYLGDDSYVYLHCKNNADEGGNVDCDKLHIIEKYTLYKSGLISYDACWSMHCKPLPAHSVRLWEICKDCKGRDAIGFVWAAEFYGPENRRQRHLCLSAAFDGYRFCGMIIPKGFRLYTWHWWPHVTVGYNTDVAFALATKDVPENCCSSGVGMISTPSCIPVAVLRPLASPPEA